MNYTKRYFKNGKKVKLSIHITKLSDTSYRISEFSYSKNGKDFISDGNKLQNDNLIYVAPKTFGKMSKLLLNNKLVKHSELGALTCFHIDDNIIIPCSLIDEAIDAFPKI